MPATIRIEPRRRQASGHVSRSLETRGDVAYLVVPGLNGDAALSWSSLLDHPETLEEGARMIDHVIVTVSDFDRSKAFYERALAPLRMTATPEFPWGPTKARGIGFGGEDKEFFIVQGSAVRPPFHVAFRAATRAEVQAFHREALAAGGRDNGAPELSPEHHADYYAAYVFDPDGHNVEAVCHEPE